MEIRNKGSRLIRDIFKKTATKLWKGILLNKQQDVTMKKDKVLAKIYEMGYI